MSTPGPTILCVRARSWRIGRAPKQPALHRTSLNRGTGKSASAAVPRIRRCKAVPVPCEARNGALSPRRSRGGRGNADGYEAPRTAWPHTAPACAQLLTQPPACLSRADGPPAPGNLRQRPCRQQAGRPLPLAPEHLPCRRGRRACHFRRHRRLHGCPGRRTRHLRTPARYAAGAAYCSGGRSAVGAPQDRQTGHPERSYCDDLLHCRSDQGAPRPSRISAAQVLHAIGGASGPGVQGASAEGADVQSAQALRQQHASGRRRPGRPAAGSRRQADRAQRNPVERRRTGDGCQ